MEGKQKPNTAIYIEEIDDGIMIAAVYLHQF